MAKLKAPTTLGEVIAERELELVRGRQRTKVRLRIGKPVVDPSGTPWWCAVELRGRGVKTVFQPIAGADSVQALLLALEFATRSAAGELGGELVFAAAGERVILARQALSWGAETAILALVGNMKRASTILDGDGPAARKAGGALEAIATTGGLPPLRPRRPTRSRSA